MNKFLSLIMSCLLLFSAIPFTGFAKGLEQSNVIDSIKLAKTDLQAGESVKLNVTFSEKNEGQIKAGDTITIKLPQMSDAFGKAGLFGSESDSGTEIKNSDGIVLGILTVTEGEVKITFTEAAENLDNIRGKFSLYASVKNNLGEDQNKENNWTTETDFGVDVSKEHISVNRPGRDEGQVGGNPFFYKTGESQSDHKRPKWWLVTNPDRHELYPYSQPTKINDQIKPGHILIEDSVRFSIGGKVNETLTPEEFMAKGYGKYHSEDKNHFSVEIAASILNGSSVAVVYQTRIVDPTLENFENTASATYPSYYPGVEDTTYHPQEVSHTVANYMSSAEIEGDMKNSISLIKVDANNESKLLANAVFDLLQNGETVKTGLTTDDNGKIIIKHLKPGKYQVKETKAPAGYVVSKNNVYDVEITSSDNKPTITVKNSKFEPIMPTEETIETEESLEEIETTPSETAGTETEPEVTGTASSESVSVTEDTATATEEIIETEESLEEIETTPSETAGTETEPEVTGTASSESVSVTEDTATATEEIIETEESLGEIETTPSETAGTETEPEVTGTASSESVSVTEDTATATEEIIETEESLEEIETTPSETAGTETEPEVTGTASSESVSVTEETATATEETIETKESLGKIETTPSETAGTETEPEVTGTASSESVSVTEDTNQQSTEKSTETTTDSDLIIVTETLTEEPTEGTTNETEASVTESEHKPDKTLEKTDAIVKKITAISRDVGKGMTEGIQKTVGQLLPQTGESKNISLLVIGGVLIGGVGFGFYRKNKK